MSIHVKILKSDNSLRYKFICPACNCDHIINDTWQFNGDLENPTFSPSIKVDGFLGFKDEQPVYGTCHSFVRDGKITYCDDCTHDLKNQTVELLYYNDI